MMNLLKITTGVLQFNIYCLILFSNVTPVADFIKTLIHLLTAGIIVPPHITVLKSTVSGVQSTDTYWSVEELQ